MKRKIMFATCFCMASTAYAGGYRVSLQGQKALGMGHTGVAMSESSEVVFFNPAGMPLLQADTEITGGITLLDGTTKYQNVQTNTTAETDNPLGTPVGIYMVKKYDEKLSWGLGFYTPYGNKVEWPTDWAGSHLVNNIELITYYIQPTIAYQVNDQVSVGAGLQYVTGTVSFNRNLSTSLADSNGNRSNVTLDESGVDSWGYNIGLLVKTSEQLSFGASYRSKVDLKARGGSADFRNVPSTLSAVFTDQGFNADLVLPAELTLGLTYQLDADTVLAFDINRTFWDDYNNLDIDFVNDTTPDSPNPRNYQDSNIYRIGIQRRMNTELTLRGGMYYDKTPVLNGFYTPETARNDALAFTAGGTYAMSDNLEIDFSFLIITFDEFEGRNDNSNFTGSYKTSASSIGAGFNYRF